MEPINNPYQNLEEHQRLNNSKSEYDQIREKNKNSILKSVLMILKLAVGMGIMVLPFLYSKNGYILGSFIVFSVILNMYYTSTLIIKIADDMEEKNNISTIQNFEEVALHLTSKKSTNNFFFWFIKVSKKKNNRLRSIL